ncbi:recombinase family protein [Pseudonocardia sp. DSM 45834]|uniref:Recombinase family protein n=1 Tax=Pseudonocardia charpentierae TaxID=3075545 RepID=A0ABU2NK37_9PSEU|nr:recombinase family protein [Pseudonocardia sp. DSM 45834]MDT0353952.1 recombinase family protein [Pseudonocardia sp. DSM 45834]
MLEIGMDTSTPMGELVAATIAGTAPYECQIIGQRTRESLAAKRCYELGQDDDVHAQQLDVGVLGA